MRFDLYTRADRANEAMANYRQYQFSKYWAWLIFGTLLSSEILLTIATLIFPEVILTRSGAIDFCYKFAPCIIDSNRNIEMLGNWDHARNFEWSAEFVASVITFPLVIIFLIVIQSSRSFAIFIIATVIIFVAGYRSSKVIAVFQGLGIGFLAAILGYSISWLLLWMIGVEAGIKEWVPVLAAGIVGFVALIMGITGAFLPDV